MPTRIETQKQNQYARKAINLCYLCGERLGKRPTSGDHVVPKSLLGTAPSDSAWPAELDVHVDCHDEKSRLTDQHLSTWHALNTGKKPNLGNFKSLPIRMHQELDPSGITFPVVSNAEVLSDGIWTCILGCYTLLYGRFLSPRMPRLVFPPNPGYSSSTTSSVTGKTLRGIGLEETERQKRAYLGIMAAAIHADAFDGIRAWGDSFQFTCSWIAAKKPPHRCFWVMTFSGLAGYIRGLPGAPAWCGEFQDERPPPNRSIVTEAHIDAFSSAQSK